MDDYIERDVEGSCRCLFLGTVPVVYGGAEGNNENVCRLLSQDDEYVSRRPKQPSAEYEAGPMTTEIGRRLESS
jgi:hypothetical protein